MKAILCFGDSNTYGVNPEDNTRFGRDKRWTGLLQANLGPDYYVIEEGYSGRTTCFSDDSDPFRSGIKMLDFVLKTHSPLNLIVIMLGTNDFKTQFSMTAKVSGYALKRIVEKIHKYYAGANCPKILLVSPIMMGQDVENSRFWECDKHSYEELKKTPAVYAKVANMTGCAFFDASTVASAGSDCLHMTQASHKALAEALTPRIVELLK